MTVYILTTAGREEHATISKVDIKFVDASMPVNIINVDADPYKQIKALATIDYKAGDIICIAGTCLRHTPFEIAKIAAANNINYMPGTGVDHRGVTIQSGKIYSRNAIEKNYSTAWPYIMIVGNPESAKLSFEIFEEILSELYWPNYVPEVIAIEHLLAAVAAAGHWETPEWFKIVDMNIRDLELAHVMYASHNWDDWIAFYPSNGNFKLENHAQLLPVWLADSTKPLEYWKNE
jgi:hypothetical protein